MGFWRRIERLDKNIDSRLPAGVGVGGCCRHGTRFIDERIDPAEIRIRSVREAPVGIQRQRAMRRMGHERCYQVRAGRRCIVAQNARRGDRQCRALQHAVCIVVRNRRRMNRLDVNADGGHIVASQKNVAAGIAARVHIGHGGYRSTAGRNISRAIREIIEAVEITVRRIGEAAVGVELHRAVQRIRKEQGIERIAGRPAVVAQHSRRDHGKWDALGRRIGVVLRHRR